MLKVLPIKNIEHEKQEPYFLLTVTLGYGEHCNDTFTERSLEINDENVRKFNALSEEEMDKMDYFELKDIADCITEDEATKLVELFKSLEERNDDVIHLILNDGPDEYWWKECCKMTDEEFNWFKGFYEKYERDLFNPTIDNNWYGVVSADIYYYDEDNKEHNVEIVH